MLGLLTLCGLVIGLLVLIFCFKILFAVLVWPIRILFGLLGAILQLALLPFELLGAALLLILLVPLLLIGVPILLAVGIPVVLLGLLLLPVLLVVGGLVVLARLVTRRRADIPSGRP